MAGQGEAVVVPEGDRERLQNQEGRNSSSTPLAR
jgi:hypothetical protein